MPRKSPKHPSLKPRTIEKAPAAKLPLVLAAQPPVRPRQRPVVANPPGTQDFFPDSMRYVEVVEQAVASLTTTYQFERIATPVFEDTRLFLKGLGEDNPVVAKQLIHLTWPGEGSYTLRPDQRVGIARAYVQQDVMPEAPKPLKYYAVGPVFRYETALDGEHWRQFTQLNFEILGSKNAVLDAQLIQVAWKLLRLLGLADYRTHINSVGCAECRPGYVATLKEYYELHEAKVCRECRHYSKKNPLRVLDCQEEKCQRTKQDAPQFLDALCETCHEHLKRVLEYLDELDIPYELTPSLVRDLDYYTRTVFEIRPTVPSEDPTGTPPPLFGGGRYNDLIERLGGLPTPAVGIAASLERLVRAMREQQVKLPKVRRADVYLAQLSEKAKKQALTIFDTLRDAGIRVVESFGKNAITAQIEHAIALGVRVTLILGQKEVLDGTIILRDMENGVQEIIDQRKIIAEVQRRLREDPPPPPADRPALPDAASAVPSAAGVAPSPTAPAA